MASQSFIGLFILMVGISMAFGQSQYHSSDPQGNFKVSYTASDGHYLVEDRSADGTTLLGNFGYRSSGGEQVGVAYGSDGAGFVIRAPSSTSSSYSSGGGQQPQRAVSYQPGNTEISYNSVSGQSPERLQRYRIVSRSRSRPVSTRTPSRQARPTPNALVSFETTAQPQPHQQPQPQPQLQEQFYDTAPNYLSYYNAATLPTYPPTYQIPTLPSYNSVYDPTPNNYYVAPEIPRNPITYSFSSYNDPYYTGTPTYIAPVRQQYVQPVSSMRYRPATTQNYIPANRPTDMRTLIQQTLEHQRNYYSGPSVQAEYPYYGNTLRYF